MIDFISDKLLTEDYEIEEIYNFQDKIKQHFQENQKILGI